MHIDQIKCLRLTITGTVQGLGFRPSVYRSATEYALFGSVGNQGDQVEIVVQGEYAQIKKWQQNWQTYLSNKVQLDSVEEAWLELQNVSSFNIIASHERPSFHIPIPRDLKICSACVKEFYDPNSRCFLYPFICCSECGPRYSILRKLPYDRKNTTLDLFSKCAKCEQDYNEPKHRRFHAQNTICPECGPRLQLIDAEGETQTTAHPKELISRLVSILRDGKVIAVKGIGGFQLVCNARNKDAIKRLRKRKNRPHQALAVMANIKHDALDLLNSDQAPIVIDKRNSDLPLDIIAPDTLTLGVMLPTSAIHLCLFGEHVVDNPFDYLIVTSANSHGEPMVSEYSQNLFKLADYVVDHDRMIVNAVDDSVCLNKMPIRLSRAYAPIEYNEHTKCDILAMGADLKNTFSFSANNKIIQSQHIGDLYNIKALQKYENTINALLRMYRCQPQILVSDLHPGYASTQHAVVLAQQKEIKHIQVQHHHAHLAALAFEHSLKECIVLTWDGGGYGNNSHIWGGECFILQNKNISRCSHLSYSALYGGEAAIKHPRKQCQARLFEAGIDGEDHTPENKFHARYPQTSSMGRFFDAVSALLLPQYAEVSYEGQAAIGLETLASTWNEDSYSLPIYWQENVVDIPPLFRTLYELSLLEPAAKVALIFHRTVAEIAWQMAQGANKISKIQNVGFSGGVFQNQLLCKMMIERFSQSSFKLHLHEKMPCNDANISVGQIVVAQWGLENA